jgi:hypothetical protein
MWPLVSAFITMTYTYIRSDLRPLPGVEPGNQLGPMTWGRP